VLNIWRACPPAHPPEACLINFYDFSTRMGLHQDRNEPAFAAPVVAVSLGDSSAFVTAVCGAAIRQKSSNCAPAMLGS
jgi:DNA oxidative demethylase